MSESIVIAQPAEGRRLLLLFHGVGATAASLRPLGEALAAALPDAFVASVSAHFASDLGAGRQWFSVRGIDEHNRPARLAEAMPHFVASVRNWQEETGLGTAATTLAGFSQGAIMSLASTQQPQPLAGRIVAIAGRFANAPRRMPWSPRVHLMHGEDDRVMPVTGSAQALQALHALGHEDATLDRFAGLGHGIDARVAERTAQRLREA